MNALGEVAGCRACREERGFLPEGGAGPDVLFWECSKGFCRLEKEMQAFSPSWFRITSYIWPSCRLPLFCGVRTACSTHFGRGIQSEKQIASCSSLPGLLPVSILKELTAERAYTQGHICLVWGMVGTKCCTPIPWPSLSGLYSKTVLSRLLVTLYNNASHCPCLAES